MKGFVNQVLNGNAESPKINGGTLVPSRSLVIGGIASPSLMSVHS